MATISLEDSTNGTTSPPIDTGAHHDATPEAAPALGARIDALGAAMKKHPLLAIGLGIVVGYLLARIIDRG